MIGDFIHNILEAVAIGIVFMTASDSTIIDSTIISIYIHEIAHELADVGILLKAKFTPKQVLLFNSTCNFSAPIGCVIVLAISSHAN